MNQRLGAVESTLLDLAEQQRLVVRYTKTIAEPGGRLDGHVSTLEARVDKLESKRGHRPYAGGGGALAEAAALAYF